MKNNKLKIIRLVQSIKRLQVLVLAFPERKKELEVRIRNYTFTLNQMQV